MAKQTIIFMQFRNVEEDKYEVIGTIPGVTSSADEDQDGPRHRAGRCTVLYFLHIPESLFEAQFEKYGEEFCGGIFQKIFSKIQKYFTKYFQKYFPKPLARR